MRLVADQTFCLKPATGTTASAAITLFQRRVQAIRVQAFWLYNGAAACCRACCMLVVTRCQPAALSTTQGRTPSKPHGQDAGPSLQLDQRLFQRALPRAKFAGEVFLLCSYRVRGVGGSCAEHLTVESYTIIISLRSYLLLLVFHHHSLFHSRLLSDPMSWTKEAFLQILPTAAFPFSPSGFTIWISQTVYCYF